MDGAAFKQLAHLLAQPCAFGMCFIALDECKHRWPDRYYRAIGVALLSFAIGLLLDACIRWVRARIRGRRAATESESVKNKRADQNKQLDEGKRGAA
jgi:hypothetical protein